MKNKHGWWQDKTAARRTGLQICKLLEGLTLAVRQQHPCGDIEIQMELVVTTT